MIETIITVVAALYLLAYVIYVGLIVWTAVQLVRLGIGITVQLQATEVAGFMAAVLWLVTR